MAMRPNPSFVIGQLQFTGQHLLGGAGDSDVCMQSVFFSN